MTKLYENNAVEIVAVPDGVVIVAQEDSVENQAIVTYRLVSFRGHRVMPVTKDIYLRGKFGEDYAAIAPQLPDYINYKVASLPDGRLLCVYPTGESVLFSTGGFLEWRGKLTYQDMGPSGVACVGNALWVSFSEGDTILRYNLEFLREELRIGSRKDNAFSRPCSLSSEDGRLIVCNRDSCCVESVDPRNYAVQRLYTFDEPVYQYVRSGTENIVLLASGVYQV